MRNLKKVLSLTLALVMMLGMMTFAGAAETKKVTTSADLTDMDKVVNKEAVSLLVDLKIVAGRETGAFDPAGTLKRGEFAKMICVTKLGSDKGANLAGGASPLTDIKGHWAEGYIKYCYSTKIVAGTSPTTFSPEGELKVVEAAKMLLTALGYDAELSKYNNDPFWNSNIMTDAQVAGLMEGISQTSDEKITRDNAAQMILNALFANQVKPEIDRDMGKIYLTGYVNKYPSKNLLGEFVFGLAKVTGVVTAVDGNGKATISSTTPANFDGAVTDLNGRFAITPAMIGAKVSVYVKGTINAAGTHVTASSVYSSVLTANSSNVLATNYGYKVQGTDALTALLVTADTKVASIDTVSPYSGAVANLKYYVNGAVAAYADAKAEVGKAGIVTEFKDTNTNGGVDTVVITKKLVKTVLSAPVMSKDSKGNDVVTFSTLGMIKVAADTVVGYEGLVKDDVILYVTIGGVTYIEKAASVEGIVTGLHNTKGMLVGGSYYKATALTGTGVFTSAACDGWTDFDNTYAFFLDNGKNIVKSVQKTDEKTAGKYAVLSNIALVKTEGVDGTHYVEGKIVKTDGTVEKVKIASIDGVEVVLDGKVLPDKDSATANTGLYCFDSTKKQMADTDNAASTTFYYTLSDSVYTAKYFAAASSAALIDGSTKRMKADGSAADASSAYAVKGQVYEYTINADGQYVLTTKLTDATYGQLTAAKIFNNKAVFNTGLIGNSSTVFLYESADGKGNPVYTAYTGIANVPTTSANVTNAAQNTVVVNKAGVATFVYAKISGTTSASSDYVYLYDVDAYTTAKNGNATYYIFDAVVNGKNETVKLSGKPGATGLYPVASVNDKGVKTLDVAITGDHMSTGVISVAGGSLVTNTADPTAYTYDADTQIFYVDGKDNCAAIAGESLSLNAYDTVYVIETGASSGIAKIVYVIHKAPTLGALTITAQSPLTVDVDGDLEDGVGKVTGWAANTNTITITATTAKAMTEVVAGTLTFNDAAVTVNVAKAVPATGTYTIKVLVTDKCSGAQDVITATLTVE